MKRLCSFHLPSFIFIVSVAPVCAAAQAPAAAPHAPTRPQQSVPFAVGETLVYDVSWSSFVTAGLATLAVQERTSVDGANAYHIAADGRPTPLVSRLYNLYYKIESWLDAFTLLPRRSSTYTEEGGRKRSHLVTFDQKAHKATINADGAKRSLAVPPLTQDPLSALYVVRVLRIAPGTQLSMPVVNKGELNRVALTAGNRERIECGLGTVQATRIDLKVTDAKGDPVGRNLALWLTTGRRQVPVQMKADLPFGTFRLVLREARGLAADAPHGM